jgi:hypothetical protein
VLEYWSIALVRITPRGGGVEGAEGAVDPVRCDLTANEDAGTDCLPPFSSFVPHPRTTADRQAGRHVGVFLALKP